MKETPKKWCIKRTARNYQAINAWANKKNSSGFDCDSDWLYFDPERIPSIFSHDLYDNEKTPAIKDFEIINFGQFKKNNKWNQRN